LEEHPALFFENSIGTFTKIVDGQCIRGRIAACKIDGLVFIHGSLFYKGVIMPVLPLPPFNADRPDFS
jgi:hypothetical protein